MALVKIYIASPYTKGDKDRNTYVQILAADVLACYGFVPYAPLLNHFWHGYFPHDYDFWLRLDLEWLPMCDALLRLPGESEGADKEVARAIELHKPVFYSLIELLTERRL